MKLQWGGERREQRGSWRPRVNRGSTGAHWWHRPPLIPLIVAAAFGIDASPAAVEEVSAQRLIQPPEAFSARSPGVDALAIPDDILGAEVKLNPDSDLWSLVATPTPTVAEMLRIGLVAEDPLVRREALAAGVAAIDSDPLLQGQAEAALEAFRAQQVEAVQRMGKKQFAREIMQALGASAVPRIRVRADRIGRRLRD